MVNVYIKRMSLNKGRRAIDPRVAIGSLIIKHYYRLTDEETIELIKENPYLPRKGSLWDGTFWASRNTAMISHLQPPYLSEFENGLEKLNLKSSMKN